MANVFPSDPGFDAAVVTPSDTGNIGNARGLFVGAAGNVRVLTAGGSDVTFTAVPAGAVLPIQCSRVYSTNTTASNIVAFK